MTIAEIGALRGKDMEALVGIGETDLQIKIKIITHRLKKFKKI
jgi:hypothetical protein